MFKYSAKRICLPGMLPGMVVGIAISLLLTGPNSSHSGSHVPTPASRSDVARLSFAEISRLPHSTLECLCDEAAPAVNSRAPAGEYAEQRSLSGESAILAGIANTRRLLPVAKKLSITTLLELGKQKGVPSRQLSRAKEKIEKVDRVTLDPELVDSAAVRDDRPREIRIGWGYAETLISDDDAVFLLAHELTHVAAQTGGLDGFIENISRTAKAAADVEVSNDQQEDLACDFIGTQVLKRYIDMCPTGESKAERLLRACGYESPSERLARAWDDFCASYNGFAGDTRHLSQALTVRALAGLDPEVKAFVDRASRH